MQNKNKVVSTRSLRINYRVGVLKHKQLKIKFGRSITDSEVTVVGYESYTVLLTIIGKRARYSYC